MARDNNFRMAVAENMGRHCAIEAYEAACGAYSDDAGESIMPTEPLPGDWDALEGKVLDPTETERSGFAAAYREQLADLLAEKP